ncbi:hypothetical protein B0T17DRAFT_652233 [Bombardia bombarda]|uniref:Uncharacterized protein n=1 Tax=Bombardia bombarda TaxID=252184 RepID=A0AA40C8D2_9PEZI|nr:hypothetical protein B0T17DRAFT_652233 [Bombardia bombarda]
MTMVFLLAAALLCAIIYKPPPTTKRRMYTNTEKLARLDWGGYDFLAAGLVLFCLSLSYSKNPYEWSNPTVSATFAIGLVIAALLVFYETYFKKDGMFHHDLFTGDRNFSIATLCVFCEGVAFFAANTYFAFEASVLYETDALLVGVRYSIMMNVSAIAASLTAYDRNTNTALWGYHVLLGAGLGMTLTMLVIVAQISTPPELISIASGLIISICSLRGTVRLAIYNALFNSAMERLGDSIANAVIAEGLDPSFVSPFITAQAGHNYTAILNIPNITKDIIDAGGVALILSMFLFDPQKEFNMRIDAPVEKEDELYSSA